MDDNTKKIIGQRINAALSIQKTETTQKSLAQYLGVHDNVVSYWCKGTRTPNTEQIIEISKFLNVSADYLLGINEHPTTDTTVQAICEYTGLTDRAVEALQALLQTGNYNYNCTISEIIESIQTEFDNILMGYGNTQKTLLTALVQYLETDFLNNGKVLDVAMSGNLIDPMNTDRKICDEIGTDFRNIITINQIETREVIEQVLLNSIIDKLKELKRNSNFSKSFSYEAMNNKPNTDKIDDDIKLPWE